MSRGSRAVASPHVVSIGDFRPLARLRLPRPVFDYLDGGADGEVTLRENCRVFDDVTFRPRYAVPLSPCDLRTRVLGFEVPVRPQSLERIIEARKTLARELAGVAT